eukprot:9473328-Pyramimonas_sp.AAC.1
MRGAKHQLIRYPVRSWVQGGRDAAYILNVVVPKQNHNGDSDYFAMIDKVNINDYINVEILGKKYILNNKSI